MLHIIDDFVKPRLQDEIEKIFLGNNFPYFYITESVDTTDTETAMSDVNTLDVPQFFHMFILDGKINSQFYNTVAPVANKLLDVIDVDCSITRCKVNMNTIDSRFGNRYHTPHIDNAFKEQITALYYVNDSDGDTLFFDRDSNITDRITPKKGRLVWWKGIQFHAKSSPVKSLNRVVVNFNLMPLSA
jgi:2OG-Fe(II) oxygenase superfamily